MSQSRKQSAVEAFMNVAVGYLVGLASQVIIFPLVGIESTFRQNLAVSVFFTAVSLARSYTLRRFFNWFHGIRQRGA